MSFQAGWDAVNLKMPHKIPRTEFSLEYSYDILAAITGREVNAANPQSVDAAIKAAYQSWDYDIRLSLLIYKEIFGNKMTNMGHAEFESNGRDFDDDVHCLFDNVEDVLNFDPMAEYGEVNQQELKHRFEQHYRDNVAFYPDCVNMTGIYPSLITGLTYIFGWEMLLEAAGTDSEAFGALTNRYAGWMQQYYDALALADVPVIYSHDDMVWTEGAIFSPAWYKKYVFPNLKKYWAPLKKSGKKVLFVCDGNYTQFAEEIAACGNDGFWFEIFTDLAYMTKTFGQTHFLVGNADTRVLLSGSPADIEREVRRCLDLGRACPGYFMAVSNHIPPNTPVDSALYYNEVYMKLRGRD